MYKTDDLRIREIKEVVPFEQVRDEYPISEQGAKTTHDTRNAIHKILVGDDDRLLVIIGPCSIHDPDAALEYAGKLAKVRSRLQDDLLIVMRVYFEKPRTTVGWKGLINDPFLDNSFKINEGLRLARKLLVDLTNSGMPAATEYLDLMTPQYVSDLISWGAIGARTTESQVHRELASGLSCPVGFKNGTDGTLSIAIDAIGSASNPHHFLSLSKDGKCSIFSTTGNEDCHIILRGGKKPNYDTESVGEALAELRGKGMRPQVMIDFSHANSQKDYARQVNVCESVSQQVAAGDYGIIGAMVESHLKSGRQNVVVGESLEYGKSITDACLAWEDSEKLLENLAAAVRQRRASNVSGQKRVGTE